MRFYLLVLIFCSISISCGGWDKASVPKQSDSLSFRPDQEIYGGKLFYTRDGVLRLTMEAPRINRYEDAHKVEVKEGLKVHFYDLNGNHQALLTAEEGELWEITEKVVVRGKVVVTSDSGTILRTEELRWEPEVSRIIADSQVTIITQYDSLVGYGFISSPDLHDWELNRLSGETTRPNKAKK